MTIHNLKCWPGSFTAIIDNNKGHEYRKNDRDYQVGDWLILQEWDPDKGDYTGSVTIVGVDYVSRGPEFNIPEGYCVMTISTIITHEE